MREAFNQAAAMVAWFGKPVIAPWLGAFVVLIVLLLVHTRVPYIGSKTIKGRTSRAVIYWLMLMIILVGVGPFGAGGGGNSEGPGLGEKNAKSAEGKQTLQAVALPARLPSGATEKVVLVVEFVPSISDGTKAQEFACNLIRRELDGVRMFPVRAEDGEKFMSLLKQQLAAVHVPADLKDPEVRLKRSPFPGEGVLRRVQDTIQNTLPRVSITISE
jgi:hypothetical protein